MKSATGQSAGLASMPGPARPQCQPSSSVGPCQNTPDRMPPNVAEQLRQLDCDPIAGLAALAQDATTPRALRAHIFAVLATYIAPRRKAIELSGPGGGPIDIEAHGWDFSNLSLDEMKTLAELTRKATAGPRT